LLDGGFSPPPPAMLVVGTDHTDLRLERWRLEAQQYRKEHAAKVGIFGALFSGEAKTVTAGLVHEAKRFSIIRSEADREVAVGVSVRLAVATTHEDIRITLTLPNLAADAQLNHRDTRIGITVEGYGGPLGALLPAPRALDVESFASYSESFRQIQERVFGEEGWRNVAPTILSFEA